MPANGAAVRLPLEIDPPSIPARLTAGKPDAAPAATEIGLVVADAVVAVACALEDCRENDTLTDTTRVVGSTLLARVAGLQLRAPDETEFRTIAYREGKRALMARHAATFCRHLDLDEAGLAAVFNELIGWTLVVADRAVTFERKWVAPN